MSFPDAFLTLLMFISIIETSAAARDGGRGDGPCYGGELLGSDAGLGTHILACLIARSAPWVAYIKTGCMRHPAGDVTSWTHPAGFTVTNQINSAQQITQISQSPHDNASYPQYLATSITYTPFGSIGTLVNGCVPSGSCTQRQDSYDYNNRLQPVRIQLGTSSQQPGWRIHGGFSMYAITASDPSSARNCVPGSRTSNSTRAQSPGFPTNPRFTGLRCVGSSFSDTFSSVQP